MSVMAKPVGTYRQTFEDLKAENETPDWIAALRDRGIERFEALGFPTLKDEDWRFTSVAGLSEEPFRLASGDGASVSAADVDRFVPEGLDGPRLVFVDGRFVPSLSSIGPLPEGVTVKSLVDACRSDRALVEPHLARYAEPESDAFTALNASFLGDGVFVHVTKNVEMRRPIHVLYISPADAAPTMAHPRSLVLVESGAKATVIEEFVTAGEVATFSNSVTEVMLEDNAQARHYCIVRDNDASFNVATLRVQQAGDTNFASHSALLGGRLVRNNVLPTLAGENCLSVLNGLYVTRGHQHHDNFMRVNHTMPHGDSRQFYRGILNDEGRAVFSGRIIVHEGAQKTDAKQTNMNLLLSDDAMVHAKPQLEIYADDVKCTHGATVGQIDPESIYYMRARGIPEDKARDLLVFAFVGEILERMENEAIREHLTRLVSNCLSSGPLGVS